MKKIKVIVVDCDKEIRDRALVELRSERVEVVAVAENGLQCLELLEVMAADVVLTELMMPIMDGYILMDRINSSNMKVKPKIFVMTNFLQEAFLRAALMKKPTYYFLKPIDFSVVARTIEEKYPDRPIWSIMTEPEVQISSEGVAAGACQHGKQETKFAVQRNSGVEHMLDERISQVFLSMGIPAHLKGYKFLRHAIKEVIKDTSLINNITKQLYPNIAEAYNSSPNKVERAIRHSVEVAWDRGKLEFLNKWFGFKVVDGLNKPTNSELIALLVDKLLSEFSDKIFDEEFARS